MRQKITTIYIIIFLILIISLSYYFLYNIYGDEIRREPQNLFADPTSEMEITVIPINALGWKAILRKSTASFEIIEGKDLIEIIESNDLKGRIKIRSKGNPGTVGIKIKSEHSLFPDYVEIHIIPLTV